MALYVVTYSILDAQGNSKSREVIFDVADEAAVLVAAAGWKSVFEAQSKSAVQHYSYSRKVIIASPAPAADSNVDAGYTVTWIAPLAVAPTTNFIDPIESIKTGTGQINTADPLVDALLNEYLLGEARLNKNVGAQPTGVSRATIDVD